MPNSKLKDILELYLFKKAPPLQKKVRDFIVEIFPYAVIIEIALWTSVFLTVSGGFSLFAQWNIIDIPEYLYYGLLGHFMLIYVAMSSFATCQLFTSYLNCWSFYSSSSHISLEYTNFIYLLVGVVLILVVIMKLLALPMLFKRIKLGWNLVIFAIPLISILFLVSLNIVGFLLFTSFSCYFLFQIREYYK